MRFGVIVSPPFFISIYSFILLLLFVFIIIIIILIRIQKKSQFLAVG